VGVFNARSPADEQCLSPLEVHDRILQWNIGNKIRHGGASLANLARSFCGAIPMDLLDDQTAAAAWMLSHLRL
jgi:hypothetical protein